MGNTTDVVGFFKQLPLLVNNILKEYSKSIMDNKFFLYREYLREPTRSSTVEFKKSRWELRPHIFCYDKYGEDYQYVYPVVLTVNNIKSIHDFLPENFKDSLILMPSLSAMQTISNKS